MADIKGLQETTSMKPESRREFMKKGLVAVSGLVMATSGIVSWTNELGNLGRAASVDEVIDYIYHSKGRVPAFFHSKAFNLLQDISEGKVKFPSSDGAPAAIEIDLFYANIDMQPSDKDSVKDMKITLTNTGSKVEYTDSRSTLKSGDITLAELVQIMKKGVNPRSLSVVNFKSVYPITELDQVNVPTSANKYLTLPKYSVLREESRNIDFRDSSGYRIGYNELATRQRYVSSSDLYFYDPSKLDISVYNGVSEENIRKMSILFDVQAYGDQEELIVANENGGFYKIPNFQPAIEAPGILAPTTISDEDFKALSR